MIDRKTQAQGNRDTFWESFCVPSDSDVCKVRFSPISECEKANGSWWNGKTPANASRPKQTSGSLFLRDATCMSTVYCVSIVVTLPLFGDVFPQLLFQSVTGSSLPFGSYCHMWKVFGWGGGIRPDSGRAGGYSRGPPVRNCPACVIGSEDLGANLRTGSRTRVGDPRTYLFGTS